MGEQVTVGRGMEVEAAEKKKALKIDPAWEFQAPKYYDFIVGETEDDKVAAEKWLEAETSYDASRKKAVTSPWSEHVFSCIGVAMFEAVGSPTLSAVLFLFWT